MGIALAQVELHYRKRDQVDRLHRARARQAASADPPDRVLVEERAELVRAALSELSDEYNTLLTARYLDGNTVEEIARRNGSTEAAVRSKLVRARQALRDVIHKHDHPIGNRLP